MIVALVEIMLETSSGLPAPVLWIGGVSSALAAWAGLILGLRREYRERAILKFAIRATSVEAEEDEQTNILLDGTPVVPAVEIVATNKGSPPLTIQQAYCEYVCRTRDGGTTKAAGRAWFDAKIGLGEAHRIYVKINPKPIAFTRMAVMDSMGGTWNIPSK